MAAAANVSAAAMPSSTATSAAGSGLTCLKKHHRQQSQNERQFLEHKSTCFVEIDSDAANRWH
jgi:hypothetical protein